MELTYREKRVKKYEDFIKTIEDCQQLLEELKEHQKIGAGVDPVNRAAVQRYRLIIHNKLRRFG